MGKDDEYGNGGEIYEKFFKEKEQRKEDNVVKIAGKGIEIYNQTILNKLQKFDQVEISVLDAYLERALHIIKLWEAVGVTSTTGSPIRFEKKEEDILTREGKKFRGYMNRITLTKHPDLFRFTKI